MVDFIDRDAQEVFEEDFLDFAGYNLQRRALPDARDGLSGARESFFMRNTSQSSLMISLSKRPQSRSRRLLALAIHMVQPLHMVHLFVWLNPLPIEFPSKKLMVTMVL